MGLARARRWMQANGGTVSLEDAPGGGTIATIRIPAAAPRLFSRVMESPWRHPKGERGFFSPCDWQRIRS